MYGLPSTRPSSDDGPVGYLECPQCRNRMEVPIMLSEDGESFMAVTDRLMIAETEVASLREQLAESREILDAINRRDGDLTGLIARLQSQINALNVERAELRSVVQRLKRRSIGQSTSSPSPSKTSLLTHNLLLEERQTALDRAEEAEQRVTALTEDLYALSDRIDSLARELGEALAENTQLKESQAGLHNEVVQANSALQALAEERQILLQQSQTANDQLLASGDLRELKAQIAELRVELLHAKEASAVREAEIIELKGQLSRTELDLTRTKAKLAATDQQHDRVTGELMDIKRDYALLNSRCTQLMQARSALAEPESVDQPDTPRPAGDMITDEIANQDLAMLSPSKPKLLNVLGVVRRTRS